MQFSFTARQPDALLLQALDSLQQGQPEAAERLARKLLRKQPAHVDALCLLGWLALQQDQCATAKPLLERALRLAPNAIFTLASLSEVEAELGASSAALDYAHRALALAPDNAELLLLLGNTLSEQDPAAAIDHYTQAIARQPDLLAAWRNRGILQLQQGQLDAAEQSLQHALSLDAADFSSHFNLAKLQLARQQPAAALQALDQAVRLRADNAEGHNLRGIALQALQRHADALASFALASTLAPKLAAAHWNEALCALSQGDWRSEVWQKFEAGWAIGQRQPREHFAMPLWLGEFDIAGKTLLVHDEQGLGDTLQFVRFVPQLLARGIRVVLRVQTALKSLISSLKGIHPEMLQIIAHDEVAPPSDYHCPLLSLPLALRCTLAELPAEIPYLQAPAAQAEHWQARLAEARRPRIALACSGNPDHPNDRQRSIALEQFRPLLNALQDRASVFLLQKDCRSGDQASWQSLPWLQDLRGELRDFADTAAALSNCDLLISVDTSVAHLAGALGRPCWLLLPLAADWRWMHDREDTPWYPQMRLFRQQQAGDWAEVIARVQQTWLTQQGT
jgi:Tfp pilus assembly protein PilF/ADP-heptose:LPS heptosyltransferase